MVYPREHKLIKWFFRTYFLLIIRLRFDKIYCDPLAIPEGRATLLISNHYSWWDAFLLYWVNERFFHKNFFIMTLESSFEKWPFLKYLGAFSVKRGSRDIINSLRYGNALLQDDKNLILVFPQGKMQSNFTEHLLMEKGLHSMLGSNAGDINIVFAALFTETFIFNKPSPYIYLKNYSYKNENDLERSFQEFYRDSKTRQASISY